MFVRYFVELPTSPESVERILTRSPQSWLPGLASIAKERGDTLLAEVGFGSHVRIDRQVTIQIGPPTHLGTTVVIPLAWTPVHAAGLLPSLDADLEIASLGTDRTQLAINARYEPPLGMMGRGVDRAILHRVAEATLKDFLDRVADVLLDHEDDARQPGSMPT
jgi:hypothetical protein